MEVPFYEVEKTVNKQVCGGSRGRGNTIVSEILELRYPIRYSRDHVK